MNGESESKLEAALAKLEDLVPGVSVTGVTGDEPVRVIDLSWHGSNFITLTYRDVHGRTSQVVLGRDREPPSPSSRLAARVPSMATRSVAAGRRGAPHPLRRPVRPDAGGVDVHLQPLPHQIHAVYGELLANPLRFLLADDPGAGKTIMAASTSRS